VTAVDPETPTDRALEMFDSAADFGLAEFETHGISESLFARVYRKWNSESEKNWTFDPQKNVVHNQIVEVDDLQVLYNEPNEDPPGLELANRLDEMLRSPHINKQHDVEHKSINEENKRALTIE